MSKILAAILMVAFISGCSIKEIGKPITRYSLDSGNVKLANFKVDKVLKVVHFKTPTNLIGEKIWYKRESFATNSYLYSAWSQSFTDMLEQELVNAIYKRDFFKSVFSGYSKSKTDYVLEGEIVSAVQNVYKNRADVKFDFRLYLIDYKTSNLIDSKDFSYRQVCKSVDALGAIKAYNKIVQKLNKEVISWLEKSVKED